MQGKQLDVLGDEEFYGTIGFLDWNNLEWAGAHIVAFFKQNHFSNYARWGSLRNENIQLIFILGITSHSFPPIELVFDKIFENRNTLGGGGRREGLQLGRKASA